MNSAKTQTKKENEAVTEQAARRLHLLALRPRDRGGRAGERALAGPGRS